MTISDVIWFRLARMEQLVAESKKAYDAVDEPTLIAAMEEVQQLAHECQRLAQRKSAPPTPQLRVINPPDGKP